MVRLSTFIEEQMICKAKDTSTGRGYANIVPSESAKDVVYGLIYDLTPSDEGALDVNEGVPFAYIKETLAVDFWASLDGRCPVDVTREGSKRDMLVYIDRERTEDDKPREEYIFRMNMGIKDGIEAGLPKDYVDRVLRLFIPEAGRKEVEEMARKQALSFQDEK